MNVYDLQSLEAWLERIGSLPSYQRDLIDDAIFCVENGMAYRARQDLSVMVSNYRNDGDDNAATAVERVL